LGENDALLDLHDEEDQAEQVRLLYVAVTRAIYRCYLPVTPFADCNFSPLGLLLRLPNSETGTLLNRLEKLQASAPSCISLQTVADISFDQHPRKPNLQTTTPAKVSQFGRSLVDLWRMHSFSSLAHWQLRSLPTRIDRDPEPNRGSSDTIPAEAINSAVINTPLTQPIRFEFARGAEPGNLLHALFETIEFGAENWTDCEEIFATYPHLVLNRRQEIIDWITDCLNTPLSCGHSLNQLRPEQALKESGFYFQMPQVAIQELMQCLEQHRQNQRQKSQHQKNQYPKTGESAQGIQVNTVSRATLDGMMCGFIDLIFEHDGRFYIVDYKSTWLGDAFSDYRTTALQENIEASHYDLQFLIYTLALHRYLRQRIPDYDMQTHLGGIYYLYVRGMTTDAEYSASTGIYSVQIDPAVVERLDHLFMQSGEPATERTSAPVTAGDNADNNADNNAGDNADKQPDQHKGRT
jgi:exodeoxyribonuclease V beta subunit